MLFKIINHQIARVNKNVRNQGKVATLLSEGIVKSVSGGVPDGFAGTCTVGGITWMEFRSSENLPTGLLLQQCNR